MDGKDLKKILAGVSLAALVGSTGAPLPPAYASGWSATKDSAVSAEKPEEKPAGSGWSGTKGDAVSTAEEKAAEEAAAAEEEAKKAVDEAGKDIKDEIEIPAGGSGWSGTK